MGQLSPFPYKWSTAAHGTFHSRLSDLRHGCHARFGRPFNEIKNSIKWNAANGSTADKAPFLNLFAVQPATRLTKMLSARNGHPQDSTIRSSEHKTDTFRNILLISSTVSARSSRTGISVELQQFGQIDCDNMCPMSRMQRVFLTLKCVIEGAICRYLNNHARSIFPE